ncbi:sodium:glutamate symporter [Corynebacterium felinum]|uniref:ESS family glutamate:Na+ symporter n=1 Tax=Corynebacterium felinum TaxID=131318 RepID=A0ABU2B5Q4_9CORY|nr:sodium:glutamate symporter [Corynebacterium felinum]MDF5820183.1 sodium:glutamate symporter [Corynebacterium felinum]MDR7353935.1 ESS family glutamate:Na+ symporter [Corynebacterium felinum]WJY96108.1 hypothetical protein CFELI_12640 [Corynebacterium felinum]
MSYTPYTLVLDVGYISILMLVGVALRRLIPVFRSLLIPAPITAGLLGLLLGDHALGVLHFSELLGTYSSILIAIVFAAMPYAMAFNARNIKGARTMWAYSTSMFMGQWGLFILLGLFFFAPVWGTQEWFGMMLPVGFVGGFGTAAAVGGALHGVGAEAALSLGFTSATVGTLAAIVGGIIFAQWGIRHNKTASLPKELPWELRSGQIDDEDARPSIGKATTNPSSIEALSLHCGVIMVTVAVAYLLQQLISKQFSMISIPLFALSFLVGICGKLFLSAIGKPRYLDKETVASISGGSTDYLIAFGIASIVPSAVASYFVPLVVMFVLGVVYCFVWFLLAERFFATGWLERALFGWGWATAAVATGIALLKIVDPKLKSGTLNEYGVAYVGFAPFEIGMTILAPIAVLGGFTLGLGWAATAIAAVILAVSLYHAAKARAEQ